jgi:Cu+-exporting ATPase
VTEWLNLSDRPDGEILAAIAGIERGSEHFLARAIVAYAAERGAPRTDAEAFASETGAGVVGRVEGRRVLVGNAGLLERHGVDLGAFREGAARLAAEGRTAVLVAIDAAPAALLGIADRPRPTAKAAVDRLRRMGIDTWLVTGDTAATAARVAHAVGIANVVAGASPERKLEVLEQLRSRGEVVAMIGDGINDAPALAAADVGFAVGTGADVAIEAAQVTLVGGDIARVADAIAVSRRTMRIIRENLGWALAYNTVAIPMAIAGRLNPMIASAAMAMSSISVVANSLRLQRNDD